MNVNQLLNKSYQFQLILILNYFGLCMVCVESNFSVSLSIELSRVSQEYIFNHIIVLLATSSLPLGFWLLVVLFFPIFNLYIYILQVLEELGIKPKRIAGASAGAIVAALLAAGYNSSELKNVLEMDLNTVMIGRLLLSISRKKQLSLWIQTVCKN